MSILLFAMMMDACTTSQIDTGLPANHPANPLAEETVFVFPPNPFMMDMSDERPARLPSDAGDHATQMEGSSHGHDMQKMKQQSVEPANNKAKMTDHQH